MMRRSLLIGAFLFLALSGRAEPIKDPAQLLPADTLACAELRQPGHFAKEIAGLLEGPALGNIPDSLTKFWGPKGPPDQRMPETARAGPLFSPEMIREAERFQEAAIALTGFQDSWPEYVGIILPGESNAPAFFMRVFLTFERVSRSKSRHPRLSPSSRRTMRALPAR